MSEERKEKFTPGPWFFDPDTGYVDRIVECAEGEEHDPVCEVWIGDIVPKGNGFLIAAAPKMYDLLKVHCFGCKSETGRDEDKECTDCDFGKVLKEARGEK